MLTRIWKCFQIELIKAVRLYLPWIGIVCTIGATILWGLTVSNFSNVEPDQAFFFVAVACQASLTSIIPFFLLLFSASLLAGETSTGTIRLLLARPLGRGELLAGKFLAALFYAAVLVACNLTAAAVMGAIRFDFAPVRVDGEILRGTLSVIGDFALASLMILAPLMALSAFGLWLSSMCRQLITALAAAVGIYFFTETVKLFVRGNDWRLSDWLFTSYLDEPYGLVASLCQGFPGSWTSSDMSRGGILSVASLAIFLGLAFYQFSRRDLNT